MEQIKNTYPYEELNKDSREIRIFELLPGAKSDPIRGKLSRHSLDDAPEYEALSYTWGDPKLTIHIQVDEDETFSVTLNLEKALRDLRLQGSSRIIWIDAICINQGSVKERNHQVARMRYIYQGATVVNAWLDCHIDPQNPAFLKLASSNEGSLAEELGNDPKIWAPLAPINRQQYWRRAWIQQEIHFAKKLLIYCRENMISPDPLLAFASLCDKRFLGCVNVEQAFEWYCTIPTRALTRSPQDEKEWRMTGASGFQNIIEAMIYSRELKSEDPRDKFYSSLGLISDLEKDDFTVNYALTVEQIYLSIATFVLKKYQSLIFLIEVSPDTDHPLDMPSWVPDWRAPLERSYGELMTKNLALCDLSVTPTNLPSVLENGQELTVTGFRLDTIVETYTLMKWNSVQPPTETIRQCNKAFQYLRKLHGDKDTSTGKTRHDFFSTERKLHYHDLPSEKTDLDLFLGCITGSLYSGLDLPCPEDIRQLFLSLGSNPTIELCEAEYHKRILCSNDHNLGFWLFGLQATSSVFKTLFVSQRPYCGHTEQSASEGDEIWIIFRCPSPIILRREGDAFKVRGHACVPGYTHKEGIKNMPALDKMPPVVEPGQRYGEYLIEEIILR